MADILRNLNRSSGGRRICGTPFVGLRGDALPTGGTHGQSPLRLLATLPADNAVRFRMRLVTVPAELLGEMFVDEGGGIIVPPQPDGTYVVEYRAYRDNVEQPSLYDFSLTFGNVSRALTGVTATCSVGAVGVVKSGALALTGVSAAAAVGSVAAIVGATRPLTGVQASCAVGTVAPFVPGAAAITGVVTTCSVGTLLTSGGTFSRALTGVLSIGMVGSVVPSGGDIPLLRPGARRADIAALDRRANTSNWNRRG